MTDDNTTPEADEPTTEDSEVSQRSGTDFVADLRQSSEVTEVGENHPPDDDTEPTGSEAAKYRRRLRDTEKERDELAARVEAMQRQQVETLLSRERMTPKALWAVTELADVLTDDGLVDPVKVKAAAQAARKELGIDAGLYVAAEGKVPKPAGNTFTTAFKPPTTR